MKLVGITFMHGIGASVKTQMQGEQLRTKNRTVAAAKTPVKHRREDLSWMQGTHLVQPPLVAQRRFLFSRLFDETDPTRGMEVGREE